MQDSSHSKSFPALVIFFFLSSHSHGYGIVSYCSFPRSSVGKESRSPPAVQETQVWSLGGKIPWRRKWQPTPAFLPGKSHGQRNLAGYSPWCGKSCTRLRDETTNISDVEHLSMCFLIIYISSLEEYSNPLTVFEWICGVLYVALVVKKKKKTCLPIQETWVQSLVGKIPWRRAWQPTPVFLPGESHGHRSLAGYIHWVAQSQMQLKRLSIHTAYSGYWFFVRHMVLKIFSLIMWVTFLLCWYYFFIHNFFYGVQFIYI